MNERIKQLRQSLSLSQEEFGKRLGVTKAAISRIETGINNITEQMIKSICREFNVSYLWLTTGEGELFDEEEDATVMGFIDTILSGENETAINIFKMFSKFSTEDWKALQRMIDLYNSVNDKKEDEL